MTGTALGFVTFASHVTLAVLIVSAGIAFVRLVAGPSAADRVAAFDLFSVLIVAFLAAFAVHAGQAYFLDVAISYALIAFLGTVALCRFLERSQEGRRREKEEGDEDA